MAFPPLMKSRLVRILDDERVRDDDLTLYSYCCDGLTPYNLSPMGVVFPKTVEEVVEIVKIFKEFGISYIPRGAGTGLSGGAVPVERSVIVEMFHFNRIHEIDPVNRTVTAGPGVVNIRLSEAAKDSGFYFSPDPSSQKSCSLGGNVGENAGGPHTLKDGVTVNHVVGLEFVSSEGKRIRLGGKTLGGPGPDLTGLFVGSEGTFGLVTEVVCRLSPIPEKVVTLLAMFGDVDHASQTVSDVIAAGIVPAALEMLDEPVIQAIEKNNRPGFPPDAKALLIIEIEGMDVGLEEEMAKIENIVNANGALRCQRAQNEEERHQLWEARKGAFAAVGSISPTYFTQDGVVPRAQLPFILRRIREIGEEAGLLIANVFHAGDGNLHPLIMFDERKEGETEKAVEVGKKILSECVKCGGSLTGEHGIGLEKNEMMPLLFNEDDLDNFKTVKLAFDPHDLMNPGKIFPSPGKCAEMRAVSKKKGLAV